MERELQPKASTTIDCHVCQRLLGSREYGTHCEKDDGMFVPRYAIDPAINRLCGSFLERFRDVLPVEMHSSMTSSLNLPVTPIIDATGLTARGAVGRLILKNEGDLLTGSTKDRIACCVLPYLAAKGVSKFVVASTGNSTTALARLLPEYPHMHMTAFVGRGFEKRHALPPINNLHSIVYDGDYVQTSNAAKAYACERGLVWEGGFFNPARRIGLATAYLEAVEQMACPPDWYFQSVASGMGVVGVGEVSSAALQSGHVSRVPKLVAVQEATCAPMAKAHAENANAIQHRHHVSNPTGVAQALHRGDPANTYPIVRSYIQESQGDIVAVTAEMIRDARNRLYELYGIECGYPSATALAAALRFGEERRFNSSDQVLVNLTGR